MDDEDDLVLWFVDGRGAGLRIEWREDEGLLIEMDAELRCLLTREQAKRLLWWLEVMV